MKAVILLILSLSLNPVLAFAGGSNHLDNIRDLVRSCAVIPYSFNHNHVREYQAIQSHCSNVKVLKTVNHTPRAKIKIADQVFLITLQESEGSDADFYDVEIRSLNSKESYFITNVLAYGDALLGILNGDIRGVNTQFIAQ